MIDAIAAEPQFLDHIAPVWRALDPRIRGRLLVDASLLDRAAARGVDAEAIDADALRRTPQAGQRTDGPPALVSSIGDTKLGRRLGYGPFVFIEHGAGQSYLGDQRRTPIMASYPGGPDREDVGLILVPNEWAARPWRASYPATRLAIVGSPRVDDLPDPAPRDPIVGPIVAISAHFPLPPSNAGLPPEANTAIGEYGHELAAVARRWFTIGHGHPRWDAATPGRRQRMWKRWGLAGFMPEFDDVVTAADVYVCDNSSTIYEFAATGRPVVLLNSRSYRHRIEHGLRFWDAAGVGIQVSRPAELVDAIATALDDAEPLKSRRAEIIGRVYPYRGAAALMAAAAIEDWLR